MTVLKDLASKKLFWILLIMGHFTLLVFLYLTFGFNTLNEGDKYLTRANYFANGDFINSTQYQTFYIAYVAYLSIFVFFKLPTLFIFISTYSLSIYSYYKFYQLITQTINKITASIWLLVMCLSPLIQYWQFNLFSETFFIAINLLFAYVCLMPNQKQRITKLFLLGLIVVFSRPSGIFSVICLLLLVIYKNKLITKKTTIILGTTILSGIFLFVLFVFQLPYHDFSKYISNGSIYYGFPSWTNPILPEGNYTLLDCYQFIYHQKGLKTLLILFVEKLNSYFLTTRAYYSNFHNLINKMHHVFYAIAIAAMFISNKKDKHLFAFLTTITIIIILNALMVGLIFNEWSERHTVQVFPFIFLLASYSINQVYGILKKSIKQPSI